MDTNCKNDTSAGRRVYSMEGQELKKPVWIVESFVATAFIVSFIPLFLTMLMIISPPRNSSGTTFMIISWIVAFPVVAFVVWAYFSNKNETMEKLEKNKKHLEHKATLVGAARDKQNFLDQADMLDEEQKRLVDEGWKKISGARNVKEGDWAIMGGIGQAIGGIGGGFLVASSTIANNQKIREDNAIRTAYREMVTYDTAKQCYELKQKAAVLRNTKVSEYAIKEDTERLFSQFTIEKEYYRSYWGPMLIGLTVHNSSSQTVYGSLNIVLSKNGNTVTTCPVLLPDDGIESGKTKKCYALCPPIKFDAFCCIGKNENKEPWHDSMIISGIKLWTKN